jgi:hypothetical protein
MVDCGVGAGAPLELREPEGGEPEAKLAERRRGPAGLVPGGSLGAGKRRGVECRGQGIVEPIEVEAIVRGLRPRRGGNGAEQAGEHRGGQARGAHYTPFSSSSRKKSSGEVRAASRSEMSGSLANCAMRPSTGRYWLETSSGGATMRKKSCTGRPSIAW